MIKIKFFTAIALSLIINSCSGQKSKNEIKESISSEKKLEENRPNTSNSENFLFYSEINNQISQVVRTIFQDSKGIFWFGTQNGAFKFDGNSLIHIDSIKNESGKGVTIKDIAEDKDGIIWFGHEGGISSIDKKVVTNYYESDGLISNDVWCITTDRSNQV